MHMNTIILTAGTSQQRDVDDDEKEWQVMFTCVFPSIVPFFFFSVRVLLIVNFSGQK